MRVLFTIYLYIGSLYLFSQELKEQKFNFYNPEIRLYVIGEDHYNKSNAEIQLEIIRYLQSKTKVDRLILETPKETVKIYNEFILFGTKESEVDELNKLLNRKVSFVKKTILNELRRYNKDKSEEEKIEVRGLDWLSYDGFHRQMKALSICFAELESMNRKLLSRYLFSEKIKRRGGSLKIIDSLLLDVQNNKDKYKFVLKSRFYAYQSELKMIKYEHERLSFDEYDSIRESNLSANLFKIVDSNKVSIAICGLLHALYYDSSTFENYYLKSMIHRAKLRYTNTEVYSILLHYYKYKLIYIFSPLNFLNNKLRSFFDDKRLRYWVVTGDNLQEHKMAKVVCDMIIVLNVKRLK